MWYFEKVFVNVNRKFTWNVLCMRDISGELIAIINGKIAKECEVRLGCILFSILFHFATGDVLHGIVARRRGRIHVSVHVVIFPKKN